MINVHAGQNPPLVPLAAQISVQMANLAPLHLGAARGRRGRHVGQVMSQLLQVIDGAGCIHRTQALAELLGAQASGGKVLAQFIRGLLALGVGDTHAGGVAHGGP